MDEFPEALERFQILALQLLLVVTLVAIAVRRLRIPYTVALVLAGLVISFAPPFQVQLTPEVILAIFVPPLIFEAALHVKARDIQAMRVTIGLLAVPGVLITTLLVGFGVHWGVGLELPIALVFGGLISATDPVAVVALFKALGAPKRLATLVEGESLFNDGTAIVVYSIALASALAGQFSLLDGIVDFLQVALGGALVGLVLGWLASQVYRRVDDYLIETTISTLLAYGSFLVAEQFHVSGVLAVVVAGIFNGNLGDRAMSPTTRIGLRNFWDFVAFISNSLLFLLIGMAVPNEQLIEYVVPIGWGVLAVVIARAVVVFPLSWLSSRISHEVPIRWSVVSFWGGLRGAISLALALSLPVALGAEREALLAMTFGVVLFTLLAQGTTMSSLLRRLGIAGPTENMLEFQRLQGRTRSIRAGRQRLEAMHHEGQLSRHSWEVLKGLYDRQQSRLSDDLHRLLHSSPELGQQEVRFARREALLAERASLNQLLTAGVLSEETYSELAREIDDELLSEGMAFRLEMEIIAESLAGAESILLLLAIIHPAEAPAVQTALEASGLPPITIHNADSLSGDGNQMLLIGLPSDRQPEILDVLRETCRKRLQRSSLRTDHAGLPFGELPAGREAGGALVFAMEVERWETW